MGLFDNLKNGNNAGLKWEPKGGGTEEDKERNRERAQDAITAGRQAIGTEPVKREEGPAYEGGGGAAKPVTYEPPEPSEPEPSAEGKVRERLPFAPEAKPAEPTEPERPKKAIPLDKPVVYEGGAKPKGGAGAGAGAARTREELTEQGYGALPDDFFDWTVEQQDEYLNEPSRKAAADAQAAAMANLKVQTANDQMRKNDNSNPEVYFVPGGNPDRYTGAGPKMGPQVPRIPSVVPETYQYDPLQAAIARVNAGIEDRSSRTQGYDPNAIREARALAGSLAAAERGREEMDRRRELDQFQRDNARDIYQDLLQENGYQYDPMSVGEGRESTEEEIRKHSGEVAEDLYRQMIRNTYGDEALAQYDLNQASKMTPTEAMRHQPGYSYVPRVEMPASENPTTLPDPQVIDRNAPTYEPPAPRPEEPTTRPGAEAEVNSWEGPGARKLPDTYTPPSGGTREPVGTVPTRSGNGGGSGGNGDGSGGGKGDGSGKGDVPKGSTYFTPSYGQDMNKGVKAPYRKGGYTADELKAMGNLPRSDWKYYNGKEAYEGYYLAPDGNYYPVDMEKAVYYKQNGNSYKGWEEGMRDYYKTFGTYYGYRPDWKSAGKSGGGGYSYSGYSGGYGSGSGGGRAYGGGQTANNGLYWNPNASWSII